VVLYVEGEPIAIDEEVFSFLKSETISLSKKLSGFINYLKISEHKGNKFNGKND
jgi:hypothetical protein